MPAAVESMAYYGEVPWHKLGTKVEKYMTAREAIAAAGLDWTVELWPTFTVPPNATGSEEVVVPIQVPDTYTIVRPHDQAAFGTVGKVYTPVQNADAFAFLDLLVQDDAAKYETAGSLFGGKLVWMLMRWTEDLKIGDDEIASYLFLQERHDGRGSLIVGDSEVRIVCANTARLARGNARFTWSFRHTTNIKERVDQARETLKLKVAAREQFAANANELLGKRFVKKDMEQLAAALWPTDSEMTKVAKQNAEQRRETLLSIWHNVPDLQSIKTTAWGAYNAVVVYADHGRFDAEKEARKLEKADEQRLREKRMASIMLETGTAAKLKDAALQLITA